MKTPSSCRKAAGALRLRPAFTLVEILLALAIVGLLVALLLPAIQAARETSRLLSCAHNVRQIAFAALDHEATRQHLPAGGWGWKWVGDPDKGFGAGQPGGWIYNVLPYLEQTPLHELGRGATDSDKRTIFANRAAQPISTLYCPSRRSGLFQCDIRRGREPNNQNAAEWIARNDYAGNIGDNVPTTGFPPGPRGPTITDAFSVPDPAVVRDPAYRPFYFDATGVFYLIRFTRSRDILDGLSATYLIGEKYIEPGDYETGKASGDDQNLYIGADRDNLRWASDRYPPRRDTVGVDNNIGFGSCHRDGLNMAYCDGSVRLISFKLDGRVHQCLGNRRDGRSLGAIE